MTLGRQFFTSPVSIRRSMAIGVGSSISCFARAHDPTHRCEGTADRGALFLASLSGARRSYGHPARTIDAADDEGAPERARETRLGRLYVGRRARRTPSSDPGA